MLTEYHELGSARSAEHQAELGRRLAQLHNTKAPTQQLFGFPVTTCCGATEQDNAQEQSWTKFFATRRIEDLIARIDDEDLNRIADALLRVVIPNLLDPLDVEPVLLHGDLWSGNVAFSHTSEQPIIFDPSSYYGHSEADLGIARMFGGFTPQFWNAYEEQRPKQEPVEQYEQRLQLYELYHHLNHMLMFGNSYKGGAFHIIEKLMSDCNDLQS
ncbi:hypothetical protein OIV83_005630 [Microbotryomycetes sp. JL201]|nr:hypothetical protein OIV83_005630 [Microbotryomycetes sp. JL201]